MNNDTELHNTDKVLGPAAKAFRLLFWGIAIISFMTFMPLSTNHWINAAIGAVVGVIVGIPVGMGGALLGRLIDNYNRNRNWVSIGPKNEELNFLKWIHKGGLHGGDITGSINGISGLSMLILSAFPSLIMRDAVSLDPLLILCLRIAGATFIATGYFQYLTADYCINLCIETTNDYIGINGKIINWNQIKSAKIRSLIPFIGGPEKMVLKLNDNSEVNISPDIVNYVHVFNRVSVHIKNTSWKNKTFNINCPNCNKGLKGIKYSMIGDTGMCSKCKFEFTITAPFEACDV
jgi:hypothetical protein